jgi:D-alanyl-D-alanine dipeptidase
MLRLARRPRGKRPSTDWSVALATNPARPLPLTIGLRDLGFPIALFTLILSLLAAEAQESARLAKLPRGLVYLRDVAPEIQQDIRYASSQNFTGRPVAGYEAAECLLTRPTAFALRKVQERMPPNRALKVYDCYRPERAVADFLAWADDPRAQRTKPDYFPTVDKARLFELGYISRRSLHSRGTAVDVTIVDLGADPTGHRVATGECFRPYDQRAHDNSLDFGTGYDCFHPLSATASRAISDTARQNRDFLVHEMSLAGFENYHREWWHFDYREEPSKIAFDFTIRAKQPGPRDPLRQQLGVRAHEASLGSREYCGESKYVKVVCVPDASGANVYANPSSASRLVAHIFPSAGALECRRCLADLAAYTSLDLVARLKSPPPWCLVEHVNKDGISKIGWVSARHLVPADLSSFECVH